MTNGKIVFTALAIVLGAALLPATVTAQSAAPPQGAAANDRTKALNALIGQANDAMRDKNWTGAADLLRQIVAVDPAWDHYQALGNALLNGGDFGAALDAYGKGLDAAEKNPGADAARAHAARVAMLIDQGNAYLKLKRDAAAAYNKAQQLDPKNAVLAFNLCATFYNQDKTDAALAACDKAIAIDPKKADAYFIKGSLMVGSAAIDANGKVKAPPGTAEALRKYLELAPAGGHVADVKQMLAFLAAN